MTVSHKTAVQAGAVKVQGTPPQAVHTRRHAVRPLGQGEHVASLEAGQRFVEGDPVGNHEGVVGAARACRCGGPCRAHSWTLRPKQKTKHNTSSSAPAHCEKPTSLGGTEPLTDLESCDDVGWVVASVDHLLQWVGVCDETKPQIWQSPAFVRSSGTTRIIVHMPTLRGGPGAEAAVALVRCDLAIPPN